MGFYDTWPEEKTEALRRMFAEGCSFGVIARELNTTRSACIGKANRLGLAGGGQRKKPPVKHLYTVGIGSRGGTYRLNRKRQNTTRLLAKANGTDPGLSDSLQTPLIDDLLIPDYQKRKILELTDETCRWPIGDPGKIDFFFCGGKPRENSPYCAAHHAVAYLRPAPQERKQRAYVFRF